MQKALKNAFFYLWKLQEIDYMAWTRKNFSLSNRGWGSSEASAPGSTWQIQKFYLSSRAYGRSEGVGRGKYGRSVAEVSICLHMWKMRRWCAGGMPASASVDGRQNAQFGRRNFVQVVGNSLLDFSMIMWYNKPAGTAVRGRADLSTPKNSTKCTKIPLLEGDNVCISYSDFYWIWFICTKKSVISHKFTNTLFRPRLACFVLVPQCIVLG